MEPNNEVKFHPVGVVRTDRSDDEVKEGGHESESVLSVVLVQSLPVVGLMIVDGCDGVMAEHSVLGY